MRGRVRGDQFKTLAKDPIKYLAYRGLRSALKTSGRSLHSDDHGFCVFIVPSGYRSFVFKSAMRILLDVPNEDWGELHGQIRLASPIKRKTSLDKPISVFDLSGLRVLIADSVNEVPLDVRFAAQEIVHVQPPTADHIRAARRVLGRSPLSDESVQFLVGKPQNIIVAAIHRTSVELTEVQALVNSASPETRKLELFELPGLAELKSWAQSIHTDVERWRRGELVWKDISRGALLSGPPGTGKTLFASALAGYLGFKLLTTTVGELADAGWRIGVVWECALKHSVGVAAAADKLHHWLVSDVPNISIG